MFPNTKYKTLIDILDAIRFEAIETKFANRYAIDQGKEFTANEIENARSRALIHLFLKVKFGVIDFVKRESLVTDGSGDGGIDGYYIDEVARTIWLIQSKFRASGKNFQEKNISYEELLKMETAQILSGNHTDINGNKYNGKIIGFIRNLQNTKNISRYTPRVILLANTNAKVSSLKVLTEQIDVEIFDHIRCYEELTLPVLTGLSNELDEIEVSLNLSNKYKGSHTGYDAKINELDVTVTILFLPAIEIAKMISKYQNSILKYNPRNYLQLEGGPVNRAVRDSIVGGHEKEFAVLNNGLTILVDEISISEKVGQQNIAKMFMSNPQIINGGQTAYTLGLLLKDDSVLNSKLESAEVVVKIIKLPIQKNEEARLNLIDKISTATNTQSVVSKSDRISKSQELIAFQHTLYRKTGILLEVKRGEFVGAINSGILKSNIVLNRVIFVRLYCLVLGNLKQATHKKIFTMYNLKQISLEDDNLVKEIALAFELYKKLDKNQTKKPNFLGHRSNRSILAQIFLGLKCYDLPEEDKMLKWVDLVIPKILSQWENALETAPTNRNFHKVKVIDKKSNSISFEFSKKAWLTSRQFFDDFEAFMKRTQKRNFLNKL